MDSGSALRTVCAELRRLLVAAASARTGLAPESLDVHDGEVVDGSGRGHGSYWSLLRREDLAVAVTGTAPPKDPARHELVGHSVPRPDLEWKLTGEPLLRPRPPPPGPAVRPDGPASLSRRLPARGGRHGRAGAARVRSVVRHGSFLGVVADREEEAIRAAELLRAGARWREQEALPVEEEPVERLGGQPAETRQVARRADPAAAARVVAVHRASYGRSYSPTARSAPAPPSPGGQATTSRCGPTARASIP